MKLILSWVFVLCLCNGVVAQQKPQYTQYIFNNYLLNPALSGIENYIDVKAGYRDQWRGLEGAPVTNYISASIPIGKEFLTDDVTGFPQQGNNPMSRNYMLTYAAAPSHHGVGVHAVIDKAGPISRTDLTGTYAYHLGLTNKLNVAIGIAASVSRISLDISKITLETGTDPAIIASQDNKTSPDLGLGIWVYGARYFFGLSAQQLLSRPLSFTNDATYDQGKQVPHYFATAGFKFFVSDDIAVVPSVMFKYVSPAPTSIDANVKVAFRDRFWIGGSYRKNDSFAALAGFNLSYLLNLSYSYDFTTSDLRSVSNGTHEIVLGLMLNNRYKVTCPQRTF